MGDPIKDDLTDREQPTIVKWGSLGPTQRELYELICEFKEQGLTMREIVQLNKERNLTLPSATSQVQRTLKALREMNLIYAVPEEHDSKTFRYFPGELHE